MKIKVNGEDQNIDIGCGGCLLAISILIWLPVIIIILIVKLL